MGASRARRLLPCRLNTILQRSLDKQGLDAVLAESIVHARGSSGRCAVLLPNSGGLPLTDAPLRRWLRSSLRRTTLR